MLLPFMFSDMICHISHTFQIKYIINSGRSGHCHCPQLAAIPPSSRGICIVWFSYSFSISLWRCATSQFSLLNIHEQYCFSWSMWLAAAMQSQSVPSFQEPRSRLLMNLQNFIQILFIPLIWYFLPILLQRDIINPVNYDFKRICDKNK